MVDARFSRDGGDEVSHVNRISKRDDIIFWERMRRFPEITPAQPNHSSVMLRSLNTIFNAHNCLLMLNQNR
jgi:hypothetical protein